MAASPQPTANAITPPRAGCAPHDPGTLTGNDAGAGVQYIWQRSNGTDWTTLVWTKDYHPGTLTSTQTYRRGVRRGAGCPWLWSTTTVTVHPAVTVDLGADRDVCAGNDVTLRADVTGGTAHFAYEWNEGLATRAAHTLEPDASTDYRVTVRDARGCSATATVRIGVHALTQRRRHARRPVRLPPRRRHHHVHLPRRPPPSPAAPTSSSPSTAVSITSLPPPTAAPTSSVTSPPAPIARVCGGVTTNAPSFSPIPPS